MIDQLIKLFRDLPLLVKQKFSNLATFQNVQANSKITIVRIMMLYLATSMMTDQCLKVYTHNIFKWIRFERAFGGMYVISLLLKFLHDKKQDVSK